MSERATRSCASPVNLLVLAVVLTMAPERAALAEQLLPGRDIRYTSGSVQSSGWEQGLVEGTPNLGHFYWSPITGYSQSYVKAPLPVNENLKAASRQPLQLRPAGSIYVKPIHVPLPANNTPKRASVQSATQLRVAGSIYVKPIHLPLPSVQRSPLQTVSTVSARVRAPSGPAESTDVSARLTSEHVNGQIDHRKAVAPMVATYSAPAPSYTGTSSQGWLASKAVHGQLVRP